jgi:hypothetical protein
MLLVPVSIISFVKRDVQRKAGIGIGSLHGIHYTTLYNLIDFYLLSSSIILERKQRSHMLSSYDVK